MDTIFPDGRIIQKRLVAFIIIPWSTILDYSLN